MGSSITMVSPPYYTAAYPNRPNQGIPKMDAPDSVESRGWVVSSQPSYLEGQGPNREASSPYSFSYFPQTVHADACRIPSAYFPVHYSVSTIWRIYCGLLTILLHKHEYKEAIGIGHLCPCVFEIVVGLLFIPVHTGQLEAELVVTTSSWSSHDSQLVSCFANDRTHASRGLLGYEEA